MPQFLILNNNLKGVSSLKAVDVSSAVSQFDEWLIVMENNKLEIRRRGQEKMTTDAQIDVWVGIAATTQHRDTLHACALIAERIRDVFSQQGLHAEARGAERVRARLAEGCVEADEAVAILRG